MTNEQIEKLKSINEQIASLREQARAICMQELAETLPERQRQAEEIYEANYPQWLKEMSK